MKAANLFLSFTLVTCLCSFASEDNNNCYTRFTSAKGLEMVLPLKKTAVTASTQLQDLQGATSADATATETYDVAYRNKKKQLFVTLNITDTPDEPDQNNKESIFTHLKQKNKAFAAAEGKDLIELDYNGYRLYGLSTNAIRTDTLSIFVCFTADKKAVYFHFLNASKSFKTMDEFKSLRNGFIGDYTSYLRECTN